MLADLDAGDVRGDGSKFAADFGWRIRFQIESIQMCRPAWQEHHDDALGGVALTTRGFYTQDFRQPQPTQRQPADSQPATASHAIAVRRLRSWNGQHDENLGGRNDRDIADVM
jgi:hypothetical protein